MQWLDDATLDAIYDAAVAADLVDRQTRDVLLQSVPDDVRLALPDHDRPDLQYRSDLRLLNVPADDGTVPLTAWLAEAGQLAFGRPEASVFSAATATPMPEPGPAGPDPDPEDPAVGAEPGVDPESAGHGGLGLDERQKMIAIAAVAGVVALGSLVLLAAGGGDPAADAGVVADAEPPVDARAVDAASPADAARPTDKGRFDPEPVVQPGLAHASATPNRPALYRLPTARRTIIDAGGKRVLRLDTPVALSDAPVSWAHYRQVVRTDDAGGGPEPATGLSLAQMRGYCDALSRAEGRVPAYVVPRPPGPAGYRLVTEDEWTAACLLGTDAGHPWGNAGPGRADAEWTGTLFKVLEPRAPVTPSALAIRGGGAGAERCLKRRAGRVGGEVGVVFRIALPIDARTREAERPE